MAFIPVVVANRRNYYHRSRSGRVCKLIFFLLILDVFSFFFFGLFNTDNSLSVTPVIFFNGLLIIIVIVITINSMLASETRKLTKEQHTKLYQNQPQNESQPNNPYMIKDLSQMQYKKPIYREIRREILVFSDIKFYRFYGTKIDRDATFCH